MNIIRGVAHPPGRIVIFGPPGVGKSTTACGAEKGGRPREDLIALDYESGLDEIGPSRVKGADSWEGSLALVKEAATSPGPWKAIVVDTLDRLEDQCKNFVCKVGLNGKSFPDLASFGYGKGETALEQRWRELLFAFEAAREHGREVILVCHAQSKTIDDPQLPPYSKWIAALTKQTWNATHRWADAILFAQHEQTLIEGKLVLTGNRVLRTEAASGYEAKNRWHLPPTLPLSWEAFTKARQATARDPVEIASAIRAMAKGSPDETKAEEFILKKPFDVAYLVSVEGALRAKLNAATSASQTSLKGIAP
jgi:hypothetical protein